jgi:hypothetical protein
MLGDHLIFAPEVVQNVPNEHLGREDSSERIVKSSFALTAVQPAATYAETAICLCSSGGSTGGPSEGVDIEAEKVMGFFLSRCSRLLPVANVK